MFGYHCLKYMYSKVVPGATIYKITRFYLNSPWLRICSWLELRGKGLVSYIPQVREEQMVRICQYVYVCVALPMIMGAWSMAVVLWQLYEYYYYCYYWDIEHINFHI